VIDAREIERYCASVAREFAPEQIVLFGSYAWGTPTPDSDVDLMVVMPKRRRVARPSLAIRQRVRAGFPVDILVRPPEEIARRMNAGDSFVTEVMTRGRAMYEAGHA
jgi:predicted nucleotidyltransferase